MTPGKLDELSAKPVASNSPRPIGADELVPCTNHGSTTDRGKFGQWKRHSGRIPCLRTKAIEGSLRGRFITIGAQQRPSEFEINPCCSGLCVRLTRPLHINRIQHVGLVTPLIEHAPANVWDHGAQIHQMSNWPTSRDQRNSGGGQ
jgi:hypothetical protein